MHQRISTLKFNMALLGILTMSASVLAMDNGENAASSSPTKQSSAKLRRINANSVLNNFMPAMAPIYLGIGDAYHERADNLTGRENEDENERAERLVAKEKALKEAGKWYRYACCMGNCNTLWQAVHRLMECNLNGESVRPNFPKALEMATELSRQDDDRYLQWLGIFRKGQMLMLGQGCPLTSANFERGWKSIDKLEGLLRHWSLNGFSGKPKKRMRFNLENLNNDREQSSEIEILINGFKAGISCILGDEVPVVLGGFWKYDENKASNEFKAMKACKGIHTNVRHLAAEYEGDEGSDEYLTELGQLCMEGNELLRMKMPTTSSWLCKAMLFRALNNGFDPAISQLPADPQQSPEKLIVIDCFRRHGLRLSMRDALAAQGHVPLASYPALSSMLDECFDEELLSSVRLPVAQNLPRMQHLIFGPHASPFIQRRLVYEWLGHYLNQSGAEVPYMHPADPTFNEEVKPAYTDFFNRIIQIIQQDDLTATPGMMGEYGKVNARILLSAALFDEGTAHIFTDHRQRAVAILDSLLTSDTVSEIDLEGDEPYAFCSAYDETDDLEDIRSTIENYVPGIAGNGALQTAESVTAIITVLRDYYQSQIN